MRSTGWGVMALSNDAWRCRKLGGFGAVIEVLSSRTMLKNAPVMQDAECRKRPVWGRFNICVDLYSEFGILNYAQASLSAA
jgi:hypothetical protein